MSSEGFGESARRLARTSIALQYDEFYNLRAQLYKPKLKTNTLVNVYVDLVVFTRIAGRGRYWC